VERLGFKLDGVLRQEDVHPRLGFRDEMSYSMLKQDFVG
jgi:RimJ/RimL family protein N-acetyltransferase